MTTTVGFIRSFPWLRLGRWATATFACGTIALVAVGIALYPAYLQEHYLSQTPNAFWTVQETQTGLAELGWPATTVAWTSFATAVVVAVITAFFGLFFIWRKSGDWFGLYLTFVFFTSPLASTLMEPIRSVLPVLTPSLDLFGSASWQLTFILFYIFPDGRFVPHWTRWMPFLWLLASLTNSTSALGIGLLLAGSAIGSQIYRYGWRSTPLQRQQSKWLMAVLLLMLPFLFLLAPLVFRSPPPDALGTTLIWALLSGVVFQLLFLLIPAAIFIAVLRYRLWDIDILIRKTLVYSAVTLLLGLVYVGSVVLLQTLVGNLADEQSPLVIVISTLLVAALFAPLRSRVQAVVDRRFFRQKYNAAQVLEQFALRARDEVELAALTAELTRVVEQTMQPATLGVWLQETHPRKAGT